MPRDGRENRFENLGQRALGQIVQDLFQPFESELRFLPVGRFNHAVSHQHEQVSGFV